MKRNYVQTASIFLLLAGCATVAVTGRSQLNLVSDQDLMRSADQNYLSLLSAAQRNGAIATPSESPQAATTIDTINRVSNRIVDASGLRSKFNWEVTVVKSDVPNAMVLPNGKIIVFSGIIPIAKSEAGLAAVIGHEVAHVAARHSAERISQVLLADAAIRAAGAVAAAKNNRHQPAISAAMGLGLQYGVLMPFSRTHESEADRIGQIYMAKAGYDPSEAIGVWERMKASSGKSKFEFLSSHPSHETRQQQLQEWLPQAQVYFRDQKKPLPTSLSELERPKTNSKPEQIGPIALRPDIREDYWYVVKKADSDELKTIRYDKLRDCDFGKCITVEFSNNDSKEINLDYGITKMNKADGSWIKFSQPVRPVKFPLAVGESWEDSVTVEMSDGKKSKGTLKTKVISYESIEVPAGSFLAYKTETSAGRKVLFEGWYVPETRGFVKSISYDSSGKQNISLMVDYQKSSDPSGEIGRATKGKT